MKLIESSPYISQIMALANSICPHAKGLLFLSVSQPQLIRLPFNPLLKPSNLAWGIKHTPISSVGVFAMAINHVKCLLRVLVSLLSFSDSCTQFLQPSVICPEDGVHFRHCSGSWASLHYMQHSGECVLYYMVFIIAIFDLGNYGSLRTLPCIWTTHLAAESMKSIHGSRNTKRDLSLERSLIERFGYRSRHWDRYRISFSRNLCLSVPV